MADPRTPINKFALMTDAGVSITFAAEGRMGAGYIQNKGPDAVFLVYDAIPAAATSADGRFELLLNEKLNLDDIQYTTLGGRCRAGETAGVEIIGLPRPGSSGVGFQ